MADGTKIEWTDATWNPIRGCTRVSEGCRNCYAEGVARRFNGEGLAYEGLVNISTGAWNGNISFVESHLLDPLKWKKPRRIFVNSMSDLFHENVTDEMRDKIFAVMALCPQHTFQVLTKRPQRMLEYLTGNHFESGTYEERIEEMLTWESHGYWAQYVRRAAKWVEPQRGDYGRIEVAGYWDWHVKYPLPNVWLGVSVENQKTADERVPLLLDTPAAVRFLSCEPLLGPVDLMYPHGAPMCCSGQECGCMGKPTEPPLMWGMKKDQRIDWVIVGGESGPNARPMHPDWARSLRDQCKAAGVPFFFKQWGEFMPSDSPFVIAQSRATESGIKMPDAHFFPNTPDPELVRTGKTRDRNIRQALLGRDGVTVYRVGKKEAGHLLDGTEHHAFPEIAQCQP